MPLESLRMSDMASVGAVNQCKMHLRRQNNADYVEMRLWKRESESRVKRKVT